MTIRHSATIYFALQGFAVIAWWLILLLMPQSRIYFALEKTSETSLLAFWLADLIFLAIGSLALSFLCFRESKMLTYVLWLVVGAFGYATIYCLAFAMLTDIGWLGVVMMSIAAVWSGNFAIGLSLKEMVFREAKPTSTNWILIKTFSQIAVVWTLVLVVFPNIIVILERKLDFEQFGFPFQTAISILLFISISFVGVSSAITMSKIGKGTPLPLDAATKLVVSGVYAYIRNPMAVSGIGQALVVGLYLGSPFVLTYAIIGGCIWQFIFRKLEEDYLLEKFGADYEKYREEVKCWIPNLKKYKA
jgi:protein-S-isoprenylcysteine O-methyltransferase Ste14